MTQGAPAHILVIKLGALGDFLQALGPMAAIRAAHPGDRITLLTTAPFERLGRDCGYFDDVWIDKRPRWLDLGGWLTLRKKLNEGKFRRVYDLQNNDRSFLYLRLFAPRPEWSGAAPGASHRNASPERSAGKAFDGHVQTLALAGITPVKIDTLSWMEGRDDFEGLHPPYVLIIPGGSPKHPYKRWPLPSFVTLCRQLVGEGYQPVLIGSESERDVTGHISASVPGALDLTGRTSLYDLAVLARKAFAAIGNDTGPMHLIAPTGCRSIVLFSGRTNPKRHAPLGSHVETLQADDLSDLNTIDVWDAFKATPDRRGFHTNTPAISARSDS